MTGNEMELDPRISVSVRETCGRLDLPRNASAVSLRYSIGSSLEMYFQTSSV